MRKLVIMPQYQDLAGLYHYLNIDITARTQVVESMFSLAENLFYLGDEEAMENLWDVIFKTVRVDTENPVTAWEKHNAYLEEKITQEEAIDNACAPLREFMLKQTRQGDLAFFVEKTRKNVEKRT